MYHVTVAQQEVQEINTKKVYAFYIISNLVINTVYMTMPLYIYTLKITKYAIHCALNGEKLAYISGQCCWNMW